MGCASFVKYILFFFNLLFALGGLLILGVGVAILLKLKQVTDIVPAKYEVAPWLFVIVGAVVFGIAFYGCCGAVREGHCMLVSYAVFLVVIIIVQVVLAVLLFVYIKDVERVTDGLLRSSFNKSRGNSPGADATLAKEAFNTIEAQLHCCGVRGASDYESGLLPDSCCSDESGIIREYTGRCVSLESGARPGCAEAVAELTRKYGRLAAWVAIGVAAVELIGAIFALYLANNIRNMERRSHY